MEMKPSDNGELLEMEDGIDWRTRMNEFREWIRSCFFVIILFVIFLTLAYWGLEKHEDFGKGLLWVGAFLVAGLITVALMGVTSWLFADAKLLELEQETLTDEEENKDATT